MSESPKKDLKCVPTTDIREHEEDKNDDYGTCSQNNLLGILSSRNSKKESFQLNSQKVSFDCQELIFVEQIGKYQKCYLQFIR